MKHLLMVLSVLLLLCACTRKEDRLILGKWKVEEYWVSGVKHPSDRFIEFSGDGTYTSTGAELTEVKGEYRIKEDKLILFQPEISDMHGNRVADSFSRVWELSLSAEWMLMEGTASSQTQDVKLVLHKSE